MEADTRLGEKLRAVLPHLNERQRRLVLAAEAWALGHGGVARVVRAVGVSLDAKKKELVGRFTNGGREWQPTGQPEVVNVHDFLDKRLGKAIPYGIDDVGRNTGWVTVGQDHDTASFAVASLRRW